MQKKTKHINLELGYIIKNICRYKQKNKIIIIILHFHLLNLHSISPVYCDFFRFKLTSLLRLPCFCKPSNLFRLVNILAAVDTKADQDDASVPGAVRGSEERPPRDCPAYRLSWEGHPGCGRVCGSVTCSVWEHLESQSNARYTVRTMRYRCARPPRQHGEASGPGRGGQHGGEPPTVPSDSLQCGRSHQQLPRRRHLLPRDAVPALGRRRVLRQDDQGPGHPDRRQGAVAEPVSLFGHVMASWDWFRHVWHCVSIHTRQVDKGVVPLAGTAGETTTQGQIPKTVHLVIYQCCWDFTIKM